MKNTYFFVWIHQICKVQIVDDGPFIFNFEIVIFEVAKDLYFHI
jgi:hypothetical protein